MEGTILKENNMMKGIVGLVLVAVIAFAGISILSSDDDDKSSDTATNQVATEQSDDFALDLSFTNLAPLSDGIYEGWIVRGDDKFSFGTFNTNEDSQIVGELDLGDVEPAEGDKVVVTIEPVPDADPGPSSTVVLAGDILNGSADLAFPVDVSNFSGKYVLATPSDGMDNNETSGVWFIDLSTGAAAVGLDIPVAPEGWTYEGWVVYEGNPISTGQFTDPATADNFDGFTGPEGVPPFPGEDFVTNLPDGAAPYELANGTSKVVISLEPLQDGTDPTGPAPAQVKPLAADVAEGAADHETFDLGLDTSSLPSGSASL